MTEPAAAQPPRRRRRSIIAVALLIALVLIVRLIWGWHVSRQLAAELEIVRSRGEPTSAAQLVYPIVADSENAWPLYVQASNLAATTRIHSPRESVHDFSNRPPYPPKWMRLAEASESAHGPVIALLSAARQRPKVQILSAPPTSLITGWPTSFNGIRDVANIACDSAELAHLRGEDSIAIQRLSDTLRLADAMRRDDYLISQLIGVGLSMLVCDTIQYVSSDLRLATPSATSTQPATRAQVRQLIDELLDEQLARESLRRSLIFERVVLINMFEISSEGTWFLRPLADQETLRSCTNLRIMIDASSERSMPDASKKLVGLIPLIQGDDSNSWSKLLSGKRGSNNETPRYSRWFRQFGDVMEQFFEMHFRAIAERRAAAIILAANAFRSEHGRWPDRLDELVPEYFPAVPIDPFQAGGRTFGYEIRRGGLPNGGDRRLIYFQHHGEKSDAIPDRPAIGIQNNKTASPPTGHPFNAAVATQYRDLQLFEVAPSTQAVDDNPEEADAPGQ